MSTSMHSNSIEVIPAGPTLTFLGTGAGCGVPAFFCNCAACEEARRDPRARRGDCGVIVRNTETTLIDTPPDLRHQLERESARHIDRVLWTHCHFDHLGGLGELEYMVRLSAMENLPCFSSPAAREGILAEFHYMDDILAFHDLAPFDAVSFDGVRYTALPVTHAPGTYGYLMETDRGRTFYASDTGRLPAETAERVRGCDTIIMDATFWGRNWSPNAHHSVRECIEEGLELEAGTLYLTHLAMHYDTPITLAELEAYLAPYEGRVKVAADGLSIPI
ncbi:MBL fold metallo-hydrolase [Adlercreutzia sp. R25]|uniref:MBL fold metallo-hydrolase n=2 Tax=Adlercreutzia shanghongiae TaxID=3111773 RepID=A0ABU6IY40_9ACTN|nr:MBL fold metallo-hydrolase [Adlercreutzia sp. R22]MEC4272670.1 MBL fold metallo-hydrolase [Adlercreutzia sp. R25]MEC4294429.1 MBL fold metallo-hydrolase [Adlercreutzia sp. R22]